MNDYISKKLSVLSLAAIILVVFIHSQNEEVSFASGELAGSQGRWVLFIENFVSKGMARIAVPLFFAISGYLFYQSYQFTLSAILLKFRKRFKGLVIPYLFWSVFGLLLFLCLQSIPWSKNFFTRELVVSFSSSEILSTVLFNPIPYQLWFVRDLIMLVLFSPLIWYLTKSIKVVWIAILVFFWIMAPKTLVFFSNESLLFFTVGCAFATDESDLATYKFSQWATYLLLFAWVGLVMVTTSLLTFQINTGYLYALNNLGILLGIPAIWSVYDHIDNQQLVAKCSALFGYTFIIFIFHEPLLTMLKKGMFFWWGKTDITMLVIYVIAPVIAIVISIFFRYVMRRHVPRIYNFATGYR